jgi:glucosamine-6-phosphate deaminase
MAENAGAAEPVRTWRADSLNVRVYPDGKRVGEAAAEAVARVLAQKIEASGRAAAIFATGASQFDFLAALTRRREIDWSRVVAFHLDEYLAMPADHPASFRRYLQEHLFGIVKPGEVHLIRGDAEDAEAECRRYEALLRQASPIDIACIGIGENGHIAFNDPPVADFNDPKRVKLVELDDACRRQQYGEGWFPTFEAVPRRAFSQTIPSIMAARAVSCVVPEQRKAEAVKNALLGPIATACPASILRRHPNAILYLDQESAALV